MMTFKQSKIAYAHIDCNSFFVSCEVFRNPALKGKFVCVGDQISIACSYEAKKYGIKTGTPIWEAERILGNRLIKILPDHSFYTQMSNKLMSYMRGLVGGVEVFSIDEFFADLTDIGDKETQGDYSILAEKIKADIYKNVGLPVSVGISNTRIKAKIFSDINKPYGSFVSFNKENTENLFKKLPVRDIPYIAKGNSEKLGLGIKTVYDFYTMEGMKVREILGKPGLTLWLELHGVDVWKGNDTARKRKSLVCSRSFNHDMTTQYSRLWRHLLENLERAYFTLITEKQEVRTIGIFLKDEEFQIYSLTKDLGIHTIDRAIITNGIRDLFDSLFQAGIIYRTTGIEFFELQPYTPKQISLFDITNKKHTLNEKVSEVILGLKRRYGDQIIHTGFKNIHKEKREELEILYEVS
ncbi:DNA polymerase IV [Candidatus Gracilibacteria bacterium]|nr:DNA polymerase IV [Candidatus Gracilibacteria bacterium]